jgi:hypothetical protein
MVTPSVKQIAYQRRWTWEKSAEFRVVDENFTHAYGSFCSADAAPGGAR